MNFMSYIKSCVKQDYKPKNLKTTKRKQEKINLHDLGLGKDFLPMTPKTYYIREKN